MSSDENFFEFDAADIVCDPKAYEAGSGGFGDVVFGYNRLVDEDVAVKIFPITAGERGKLLMEKIIKKEIKHLRKARSDNIVRVLGYVKWAFTMGIVMEYCKGGNLQALLLEPDIELGDALRLRFLTQSAKGIKACHNLPDKRLIHADLKPGNILLTEKLLCKIADFGSAELATLSCSSTFDPSARSRNENPQFTPYYTAPEKLKDGRMKPTKELDIYAFGITMYAVLTRKPPYPLQNTQQETLNEIKQGLRPDCQELHEQMATLDDDDKETMEQLVQLMKRCWAQDPSQRPNMDEIVNILEQLLDNQDATAILEQEADVVRQMKLNEQQEPNRDEMVPIHQYSTRSRRFQESFLRRTTDENSSESTDPSKGSFAISSDARQRRKSQNQPEDITLQTKEEPQKKHQIIHQRVAGASCFIQFLIAFILVVLLIFLLARTTGLFASSNVLTLAGFEGKESDLMRLTEKYKQLIKHENYKQTNKVKQKLLKSVKQANTAADDVIHFAKKLADTKDFIAAILFFDIASDLYAKHSGSQSAAHDVMLCAKGLSETAEAMMKEGNNWFQIHFRFALYHQKEVIRDHVIPLLNKMQGKIQKLKNVNLHDKHLREIFCFHYIELCQHYIGDSSSSAMTMIQTLELIEEWFGDERFKIEIYGTMLNNLVIVLRQLSKYEGAVYYAAKASEAKQKYAEWELKIQNKGN